MSDSSSLARANLIGSGWMILAMAAFAVEDSFIKAAAGSLPVGQVLLGFGSGGALVFLILLIFKGQSPFVPGVLSRVMLLRLFFEIAGRLFFTLALALTPISSATVILQATPIVVVLAAAFLFGEKVGVRRWIAIVIGLAGVMVILQPSPATFEPLSLLAVIAMIGFAGRDLASRVAPVTLGTHHLGFYGFVAIILAGSGFSLWEGEAYGLPDTASGGAVLAAVVIGVVAYSALMKAMRTGEVASVAPFRYSRLLFGVGLGVLVFGETLDATMILGSLMIVTAGLFILWRGKSVQKS